MIYFCLFAMLVYVLIISCLFHVSKQVSIIIQHPKLGHRQVATIVFPHPRAEDLKFPFPL